MSCNVSASSNNTQPVIITTDHNTTVQQYSKQQRHLSQLEAKFPILNTSELNSIMLSFPNNIFTWTFAVVWQKSHDSQSDSISMQIQEIQSRTECDKKDQFEGEVRWLLLY
jgi:DNA-binding PucR family transcriptional regulator